MAQEICNQISKDVVKAIGLNKTQKAMEMRASKAAAGVQQIVKRLNKVLDVKRVSQAHIHKSVTKDEVMMVQDLKKIKRFERKPCGRKHGHFDKIQATPTSGFDMIKSFHLARKA